MPKARPTGTDIIPNLGTLAAWLTLQQSDDASHPDTEPESIARDQREAVAGVLRELGGDASDEAVSAAVVLPVSVVRKRRAELEAEKANTTTRAA